MKFEEIINDLQRVADRKCYPEDILCGSIAQEWVDYIEDYITNLQTIEQQYGAILSENAELENKITNLQEQLHQASLDIQELTEKDIGCPSWCDKLTNLQEENRLLKMSMLEKQFPDLNAVEVKIDTYKQRNEKAIEYINNNIKNREGLTVEEYKIKWRMMLDYYESQEIMEELLNILQGEDKE